ncbi:heterokaryon incompatibility protein-domain-containing protein [Hypoxylon sp. NC1633]|nr:heterokaryon incompatibility protein-domain-containing protein [Hypoxylon sp. NC1633]
MMEAHPLHELAYEPLVPGRHEIRLIQLKPKIKDPITSSKDHILCCEVIHVERGLCQPYTALSYAWGNNTDLAPLRIGNRYYHVNASVKVALGQLQAEDLDVFVWVDQICINQQDDVEKSHQVQQMKQIYSEAETVVAWLGPATNDSDRLLRHLGRMGTFLWAGESARVLASHQNEEALESIRHAFHLFCERGYWKRLWIMQEYAVARCLTIACGNVTIRDWQLQAVMVFVNRLYRTTVGVLPKGHPIEVTSQAMARTYKSSATSFVEGVVTRRTRYWEEGEGDGAGDPLFHVLATTLALECDHNYPLTTDPRDRIFSVLQLASDADHFSCFPNYAWTCEKVFCEAAFIMLRQGHIDVLAYSQSSRDSSDMPTWAPNWRMRIRSPCTGPPWVNTFSASGDTLHQQVIGSPTPGTVVLQGVLVDSVEKLGDIWDPNWLDSLHYPAAMVYLEQVQEFCEESPRFWTASKSELGTACISIAGCTDMTDTTVPEAIPNIYSAVLEQLDSHAAHSSSFETDGTFHWYFKRLRLLHSRRPFISKTGFVGLVPQSTQPGDIVCIFLGGKIPYVIRPAPGESETYVLIGEAFVYGIMTGEFMKSDPQVVPLKLR